MPRSLFTESNLENLKALIAAKGNLIKKALGVDDLPIEVTDEKVSFLVSSSAYSEELKAYDTFICKLCEMARNAKRVVAKEKETDNDKVRIPLLPSRLGFIGAEFKTERKNLALQPGGQFRLQKRSAQGGGSMRVISREALQALREALPKGYSGGTGADG